MDINEIVKQVTASVMEKVGASEGKFDSRQTPPAVSGQNAAAYDPSYGQYMDHTVLKPETVKATLKRFCDEAKQYHFASVCVNPANIPYVASQLKGSGVKACAVIGFPFGANTSFIKAAEATDAIKNGAGEVDMVINIGALKDREYDVVYNDILAVVNASHPAAIVKVIIETSALTDEEKVAACTLAKKAGADFVKTSTGYGTGGATLEDVRLMKQVVGDALKVKASTGINDRRICDEFLKAGAVRMGTSKGIKIVKGEVDIKPEDCEKCGKCSAKCPSGIVTITKQAY
ncbi:MAG: deoxyribose-phosphate aldolase [Treponema sp.]|jgi:deoxyribose-phosphate aldolase|nr:deoxyribose-phosphate aldolase [Treponema sp.]